MGDIGVVIFSTDRKLPKMIDIYNQTKIGVDVVDRLKMQYFVSMYTRRWHFCGSV